MMSLSAEFFQLRVIQRELAGLLIFKTFPEGLGPSPALLSFVRIITGSAEDLEIGDGAFVIAGQRSDNPTAVCDIREFGIKFDGDLAGVFHPIRESEKAAVPAETVEDARRFAASVSILRSTHQVRIEGMRPSLIELFEIVE